MTGPTVASLGQNPYDPAEASTSFAAPRVARAAVFTQKCLELAVSDLTHAGEEHAWSRPVWMPWIGLADTGWDPRRAPYARGPIAEDVLSSQNAIEIALTDGELAWLREFRTALSGQPIPPVSPQMVTRALVATARRLDHEWATVGAGYVDLTTATAAFRDLTPLRLAGILGLQVTPALHRLDAGLGPWWSDDRNQITEDAFATGIRLSVARVRV